MNIALSIACILVASPVASDTWPGFRGDGTSRTAAKGLPTRWSPKENLAWRIELPGYGQSSPVVWKNRVYLTAVDGEEKEKLQIVCLDSETGKIRWHKTFPASQNGKNNPMMSRAAGTPVADGNGVYAFFESGDLIALSPEGEVRWQRALSKDFGELKNNHGLASSPAQSESALYILVDHQGPSYLLAVNKSDGKDAWKAERTSRTSWTSPIVTTVGSKPIVVVSSGGDVVGYEANSGKKCWQLSGLSGNTMPSPTMADGCVFIGASENARKPDLAASAKSNCLIRLAADGTGYEVVWRAKRQVAGTASPLVHAGHVYLVDKAGICHCLDQKTGELKYSERLHNQAWATPIGAGDYVYFFGKDGTTTVLKSGPRYRVEETNRLWSPEEFEARKLAAKKTAKLPAGTKEGGPPKGPAGGPVLPKEEMESIRYSGVGDIVYGAAAVDGAFFIRTGTELFCVKKAK